MPIFAFLFGTLVRGIAASATAAPNLVTNGAFEKRTNGLGQLGYNTDAVGWTTNGYSFVFGGSSGDTVGANGVYLSLTRCGGGQRFGERPRPEP